MEESSLTPPGEGRKLTHQSSLEALAERASNARLDTFFLPGELVVKGLIIQENLGLTPLRVGDREFDKGSLVAILNEIPDQKPVLEFRIYEKVQKFKEQKPSCTDEPTNGVCVKKGTWNFECNVCTKHSYWRTRKLV